MSHRSRASVILLMCCVAAVLHAHPISVALAEIKVERHQIHWRLRIPAADMDAAFDISNLLSVQPRVHQYLAGKVKVEQDGRDLPSTLGPLQIWKDPDGNPYVETAIDF